MNVFSRRMLPKILVPFCAAALVATTACGDILGNKAALPTVTDTTLVFAVNGAPTNAPTALYLFGATVVPATTTFTFDIAFDLDTGNTVKLIPNSSLASALTANSHPVALQLSDKAFDAVTVAPTTGYHPDTVQVVPLGKTVLLQSQDALACQSSLVGTTVYGKVVVDSIDVKSRAMFIRFTSDPNCGFRSFAAGLPSFIQ